MSKKLSQIADGVLVAVALASAGFWGGRTLLGPGNAAASLGQTTSVQCGNMGGSCVADQMCGYAGISNSFCDAPGSESCCKG